MYLIRTTPGWLVFTFSLPGAAAPSFAQASFARHTVTGFVGVQLFDLTDELADSGIELDEQVNFGGRYEYRLTERWGVEGSFSFSPGTSELGGASGAEVDVDALYYTGGVVYRLTKDSKLVPYVMGGAGAVSLDVSRGDTETKFAGTFGGGVLYGVTDHIAVRVDVRDYIYTLDAPGSETVTVLQVPADFDETINDLSIVGGITFTF